MEQKEIEFIIREQTEIVFKLSAELMGIISNPEKLTPVIESLQDGSIDPGDFEQVSSKLLDFVKIMPSYQDLLTFIKTNRQTMAKLYQHLGQTSDDEFDKYIELTQKISTDVSVEKMFEQLEAMNVVVDNRK